MDIRSALIHARKQLSTASESPNLDAEVLLAYALQKPRSFLLQEPQMELNASQADFFNECVSERATGMPVAYITHEKEFYGRDFYVDKRVLVPRPETELVVDEVKRIVRARELARPVILDIGTGSGCIALTLKAELPQARVCASDVSIDALEVAKINCAHMQTDVALYQSDLFDGVPRLFKGEFDMIVSNPPYLELNAVPARDDSGTTRPAVSVHRLQAALLHEPQAALIPRTGDSFSILECLISQSAEWLTPEGSLVLEIGHDHGARALQCAERHFPKRVCIVKKDFGGFDRVLVVE